MFHYKDLSVNYLKRWFRANGFDYVDGFAVKEMMYDSAILSLIFNISKINVIEIPLHNFRRDQNFSSIQEWCTICFIEPIRVLDSRGNLYLSPLNPEGFWKVHHEPLQPRS